MLVVEIAMAKITCIFDQTYSAKVNEAFYANVLEIKADYSLYKQKVTSFIG